MRVNIGPFPVNNKPRKIHIEIEPFDTWNADHTIALIVHPLLIQLKRTKHGAPCVDDADVPEELRSTSAPPKENEWDTDDNHFKRFDYILDSMIFSFGKIIEDDWKAEFHSGTHDIEWKPVDAKGNSVPEKDAELFEMTKGPKDTAVFDVEGYRAMNEKIDNGLRLFGRYMRKLWD